METGRQYNEPRGFSRVRREIDTVNEKLDIVNSKIENMADGLGPLPGRVGLVENNLVTKSERMRELEHRHQQHSAKLKMLEKQLHIVKLDSNRMIDDAYQPRGPGNPVDRSDQGQGQTYPEYQSSPREAAQYPTAQNTKQPSQTLDPNYQDIGKTNKESGQSPWQQGSSSPAPAQLEISGRPPSIQPMMPAHAQRGGIGKTNAESDLSPWYSQTSPRKPEVTSHNRYGNYDNTGRQDRRDEYFEEMNRKRLKEIYGSHDCTAINPQLWDKTIKDPKYPWEAHPCPGGLFLLRFEDSAFETVKNALCIQQSICRRAAGGLLLGIGRRNKLFVFESAPSKQQNWRVSRHQPYKDVLLTDNAIAAFWFSTKETCQAFIQNNHYNRFREPDFPTPNGYQALYIPLLSTPPLKQYDTFLFIEFLNGRQYDVEDMTQFEAEVRHDMSKMVPDCLPMVISSQSGREEFRPGDFVSPYSKLFVCRFEKQEHVDDIWRSGMIQALRMKWRLSGPLNVFSFTIEQL